MTAICWALQHVSDVPASDEWLSASEREVLARLWAPKRVRDWRLGRWTAKRALVRAGMAGMSDSDTSAWTSISIRTMGTGVPYAVVGESEMDWVISLSHSGEYGLCAVVQRPAVVGCDIETVGRRGEEFVIDWFTPAERALVESIDAAEQRSRLVTLVWSAKESALKALGVGLRLDTREVEVDTGHRTPDTGHRTIMEWSPLVVHAPARRFHGWWLADADRVITIVADPQPAVPVGLFADHP